jgi:hypothetical protein
VLETDKDGAGGEMFVIMVGSVKVQTLDKQDFHKYFFLYHAMTVGVFGIVVW